jgi:hypothetical protein
VSYVPGLNSLTLFCPSSVLLTAHSSQLNAHGPWPIVLRTTVSRYMTNRSIALAVLQRPTLWPTAVGAVFAFARVGWWRRAPFLPVPDGELIRWRTATAYGSDEADLVTVDVVAYIEWRQRFTQGQTRGG